MPNRVQKKKNSTEKSAMIDVMGGLEVDSAMDMYDDGVDWGAMDEVLSGWNFRVDGDAGYLGDEEDEGECTDVIETEVYQRR